MIQHHAVVCIASSIDTDVLPDSYKKQSEDVTHILCDRLSIGDARQMVQDAQQKPVSNEYRVFVIVTKKLPIETQNALLKLFEEPPEHARFYLIIPQEGMLLPTLASRVQICHSVENTAKTNNAFVSFLESSYADRIATVADIAKKKDVQTIALLLEGAESFVVHNPVMYAQTLETIIFIRRYATTQGASTKMLLEELAFSLPVVK